MPNVSNESDILHEDVQAQMEPAGSGSIDIAEEVTESDSSPIISIPLSTDDNEVDPICGPARSSNVEIEEVFDGDNSPTDAMEPVITEQDDVPVTMNEKQSDMVSEIPTVCILF